MTAGQDLMAELNCNMEMMLKALKQLSKRGRAQAQAEYDYRVALQKKILQERDKGTPVTIISDICRGTPDVARLKMERDIAEVVYKSAQEAINAYKIQIKVLENTIDREYRG